MNAASNTPERHEITATESSVVYENAWMRVREDKIVRQSGAVGIYGVVEKPDFALIAAFQDGLLHLVEQYRYPVQARYWEFPQGASHSVVTNAFELAAAELREETGLVADSLLQVGQVFPSYGFATQACNIYLATGLSYHGTQLDPEEEGLVSQAFPVAAVERMIVEGTIRDGPTVAAFALLRLRGFL